MPRLVNRLGRHVLVVVGLAALALFWGAIWFAIAHDKTRTEQAAMQNGRNLARAFEEHIIRSLRSVDQTLLYMRESYIKSPRSFDINLWQRESQLLSDFAFQVTLIDKDGFVITSNLSSDPARIDLSDREHFRVQKFTDKDELFISRPVLGRVSNRWSINVTRRIVDAQGKFAGVAVVSLDPEYLARFYSSIDIGKLGAISLVGMDGIIRARASRGALTTNTSLAQYPLLTAIKKENEGSLLAPSATDGIVRLFNYRGVKGYPLIVVVGLAQEEIFKQFKQDRNTLMAAGGVFSALLIGLFYLLQRYQAGLRRARDDLRERQLNALQKSQQLEATLENMSQGIVMVDGKGEVPVINRRALELLGLPDSFAVNPPSFSDLVGWLIARKEVATEAEVASWRPAMYERTRPNGTVIEVRTKELDNGGMVRTYSDITERKNNEKALAEARDAAERASRAQSNFLAMVSHELRTPMNAVIGLSEVLLQTKLSDVQRHHARIIEQSAEHLLGVINNILDFSRLEAGQETPEPVVFGVVDLVNNVMDIGQSLPRATRLSLTRSIGADVPACVFGDAGRVSQILLNFLSNGIKCTPQGSVHLAISRVPSALGELWLRFDITDTGPGIAPEVLSQLFKPFARGDITTTSAIGGTGLGLAISKSLAESLGGRVSVVSEPGKGSTFSCELPFQPAQGSEKPETLRPPRTGLWRPLRILVAEDALANQMVIQSMLENMGHRPQLVANGAEAVKLAGEATFDLIFMDVQMPVMDGYAATAAIRALGGPKGSVPIVALTAFAQPADRDRALAAGMTDYLRKPIRGVDLERVIAKILDVDAHSKLQDETALECQTIEQMRQDLGPEKFKTLVTQFIRDARTFSGELHAALSESNVQDARKVAHRMYGLFSQFGFDEIAHGAAKVEALPDDCDLTNVAALACRSERVIDEVSARYR